MSDTQKRLQTFIDEKANTCVHCDLSTDYAVKLVETALSSGDVPARHIFTATCNGCGWIRKSFLTENLLAYSGY